jgi:signal transduction histidine kinase
LTLLRVLEVLDRRESAAIAFERDRIGGELQDIIAHAVSVMVVQAGGARRLLHSDPERARESILNVEHTGHEALADLRRLLGVLRKADDPRSLAPQPGLEQLAKLLHSIRGAGLECELRTLGVPVDLTPGVNLVAYRVIETALLAAARHRSGRALVTIRYQPHVLELDISGCMLPDPDDSLRAVAERVALYDGKLRTLPSDGGRFALQARLPVGDVIPA